MTIKPAPIQRSKKYGGVYVVDDSIPVRDGYTFIEWNTKPDGSGVSLKAGDTYDGSDGWTLYAQWKKNEPENPNTGDGIMLVIAIIPILAISGLVAVKYTARRRGC